MDKNNSFPVHTPEDALNIIREMREDMARHEQLLANIMTFLQQPLDEQSTQEKAQSEVAQPASWMPTHGKESVVEPLPSKIRKIEVISNVEAFEIKSNGIVNGLRTTWLSRVYTRYLKQYGVIRWTAMWIWRHGYPIYVNQIDVRLSNGQGKRWRPLAKLSEYAKKRSIPMLRLADATLVETTVPKVYPVSDQGLLVSSQDCYHFPEVFVAKINNAMIYGGTNLVLADGEVVCHDLYDFERDYTSEELHGRTLIDPESRRIRWLLHDVAPETVPVAATFVDACALNYAHWMTEVLPRIALFCADDRFLDVPLVVNDGLHQNIMESLILVAGVEREIIMLSTGRALVVNELYFTSVAGYVPFGRRTNKLSGHSHGVFSLRAIEFLHNQLNALWHETVDVAWPEKIYLRRNSGARRVTNAAELERLLIAEGYVIVEPEHLTFLQQVQLFKNAREIVSSTGAALTNAINCKPGTQVTVLMSKHEDMIYRYWCNLLGPLGIKVSYVLGDIVENHDLGIHGDFAIQPDCISELLEGFQH